jgi:hypothetical protein
MPRLAWTAALAAALAALAGCAGSPAPDPYAAATPDVAGLLLETAGDPADGLAGPASRALASVAESCPPYAYLCNLQRVVADLNGFVRLAVKPVEALAATEGKQVAPHVKVYGPADLPGGDGAVAVGTFRLTVFHVGGGSGDGSASAPPAGEGSAGLDPGLYRWKLEAKPLGGDDAAYAVVMAGGLRRGEKAHRGRGTIGIDLDAARAVLPAGSVDGQGKLLASFAHVGGHRALAYALRDFAAGGAAPVPSAVLVGHKNEGGPARVRLAALGEWAAPPPGEPAAPDAGPELLASRAVWFPGVGGRAAVVVAGGDVPAWSTAEVPVDYLLGVSCYDAAKQEVYRDLFACVRPEAPPHERAMRRACADATGTRAAGRPCRREEAAGATSPGAGCETLTMRTTTP